MFHYYLLFFFIRIATQKVNLFISINKKHSGKTMIKALMTASIENLEYSQYHSDNI